MSNLISRLLRTFNGRGHVHVFEGLTAPPAGVGTIGDYAICWGPDGAFRVFGQKVEENAWPAASAIGSVTSVAGKTGVVTLVKDDVGLANVLNIAQAAAARQITAGAGLTGGGDLTADRTLAVALTSVSITLGSDVALPAATLTTVLSITLPAAGTYDVSGLVTLLTGATVTTSDIKLEAGTATGTFEGASSASVRGTASVHAHASVGALFTCTVAGTLLLRAYPGANASTAKAASANGYAGATGLKAVRIA